MSTGAVESTLEDGSQAAQEVLAGEPGPSARRWLGPLSLISFLLFGVVTILVVSGVTRSGFDIPVERFIQHVPWGPLTYWMTLTNVTGGLIQDLVGVAVVIGLFLLGSPGRVVDGTGCDREPARSDRQGVRRASSTHG